MKRLGWWEVGGSPDPLGGSLPLGSGLDESSTIGLCRDVVKFSVLALILYLDENLAIFCRQNKLNLSFLKFCI